MMTKDFRAANNGSSVQTYVLRNFRSFPKTGTYNNLAFIKENRQL